MPADSPDLGRAVGGATPTRRRILRILSLAVLLIGLGTTVFLWQTWTRPWTPPASQDGAELVRIPPGASLPAVTDTLVRHGLLRHPRLFRLMAQLLGQDRHLQAGRYAVTPGVAPRDLLSLLVSGRTVPVRVTLPEGVDAESAAKLVEAALGWHAEDFLAAADSLARAAILAYQLMGGAHQVAAYDSLLAYHSSLPLRTLHWCEGYLAPDTYHFAEGTPVLDAARTMVSLGVGRLDSLFNLRSATSQELALTPHQFLTLAAVVEAEARRDDERSRIAAVYVNRLSRGWRLEADPCIAYLLDKRGQRLFYKDLAVDSPYNTYRHAGLPPGPIGCPGTLSLQAVAAPDTDRAILFFVSDGEGGHVFSRTRKEHEEAVAAFRRSRNRANR